MMNWISDFVSYFTSSFGTMGVVLCFLVIMLESLIPVLPLGVFIALVSYIYGNTFGFFLSYIATITGCIWMMYIVRRFFYNKFNSNPKLNRISKTFDKISFSNLVVILSLPFTPAFAVNIGIGLTNMSLHKYLLALIIGKITMVYFYVYVGSSIKDVFNDPFTLIKIIVMIIIVYVISYLVNKKYKIS